MSVSEYAAKFEELCRFDQVFSGGREEPQ
ncbi:hypothetical protein A2U01_0075522, partial [Trifolium medium]|nr:hypothetical protein [Trifolium medium]